jgi:hypothetical protein
MRHAIFGSGPHLRRTPRRPRLLPSLATLASPDHANEVGIMRVRRRVWPLGCPSWRDYQRAHSERCAVLAAIRSAFGRRALSQGRAGCRVECSGPRPKPKAMAIKLPIRFPIHLLGSAAAVLGSHIFDLNGTATPARTGDPQIHNLVL